MKQSIDQGEGPTDPKVLAAYTNVENKIKGLQVRLKDKVNIKIKEFVLKKAVAHSQAKKEVEPKKEAPPPQVRKEPAP
jgi:hypothetical protein